MTHNTEATLTTKTSHHSTPPTQNRRDFFRSK
jgi:hypothetical protein